MRQLTERHEIAEALNFNKYPVINIDLADRDDYGIRGTKVNIDFGGAYFIQAEIRAFNDTKHLTTKYYGTMLKKDLSYSDYLKMAEYANAPIIKADQEIVIFLHNSETKEVMYPTIIKTGKRVDSGSATPLQLEKLTVL